jgi:hypothetical protein
VGAELEEGQVVAGRYRVGKLLGRGGMGAVHEAWDERFHERVALKVTIAAGPAAAEVEARFAREARLSNQLGREQPRIVRTRDWARLDEARLYLVMDLVDGARPLDLKGGDLAARVARVRQAAELVAAMHRAGVVHRDLKPANLLQSADGRVHLTDLGLAKVLGEAEATGAEHGLTQAGQGFGTPGFMPLEQYEDAARADARADVWALGCMLFAAVSGVYPFPGAMTQVLARLVRIRAGDVPLPRPRDLDAAIPRALDALVIASLSIEPEGRPKDAGAFAEALDAALAAGVGPGASLASTGPGQAPAGSAGPSLAPTGSAGGTPALTLGAEPTGELARVAEGAALAGSFGRSPGEPTPRTPAAPEPGAGPDATSRRLLRLVLTLFVAAPTGALLGAAGGLLLTVVAGPGVEAGESKVLSAAAFVAVAALLVAPFTSFLELLGARRAVRMAEAGAFLLALFLLFRGQDREVGVVAAIVAGVLLPLLGLRGLVAWPLVSLASATAASGAVAASMLVGDAWKASNLGAIPLTALAGGASAAALALADRIDARYGGFARRPLRGGLLGAAGHALGVLVFVAAALATDGFTRAPLDLGAPSLELQSAVATRGADGAARVRVRCLVADGSPCELQASVADDGPPVRWEVGGGPVDLEAPLPERTPRDLRVSVRARDAQGNSTWAGADVQSPDWTTADEPR